MLNIKSCLLLSIFFSCFLASAQKINQFDSNNQRTGVWKKYYKNKRIRYEGEFKNGKEIGVFKFYSMSSSNHPIAIKTYKQNNDSLFVKFYNTRGVLQSEGTMIERNRVGQWKYYFPDGKTISEENYSNGKLDGNSTTYYHNGKITETSLYKNGLKTGISKKFANDGILIEELTFANGKENGLAKYFDLKGNLVEKGNYKNGIRVGKWDFYIDGEIASEEDRKKAQNSYKKEN